MSTDDRTPDEPVDIELDVVAHHQPDQVARDAAAADDLARAAGYSDEALETLRMVTAEDDEITDEQRAVRDKTAKSMMLVGIRTVVVRALGLLGTIFLARLLSPADYGVVALGLTLVVLGRFFADGGVAPGLIRREEPPSRHEYGALLGFQQVVLWPITIVASILCFTVFDLGGTAGSATVSLMLVATIIDVMRSANSIAAERDLEYTPIVRAEIVEFAVYNVLAIGLVAGGTGIIGVGIANIARSLTGSGLVILWGPLKWVRLGWDFKVIKALARFGIFFQLSWLATLFRDQGLALILAAVSGRASLGAFDQARRLLVIVTLVFESAWRVGLPGLARMMEAGAAPKMLFQRGLGLAGVAMTFPVVGLVATCHWLVPFLLGDGWRETTLLIPWVGAAIMLTMPIATIISTLLWARDEPKKVFYMGMPALIGTLAIGAVAMTRYDAVGAGIGLTAGGVIYVASCIYYATDVFGMKSIPQFLGPILAATGASFAGYFVGRAVGGGDLPGVLVSGTVSIAVLLVLLMVLARSAATDLWRFAGKARS
ncbi:MAG: oligosaccharide flippase family protein [Solirubrobacteraceae bacterium]|nr:oligosaccharide flippase family protein [Patulibacter sp.]